MPGHKLIQVSHEFLSFLLRSLDRDGRLPSDAKVVNAVTHDGGVTLVVASSAWPAAHTPAEIIVWSSKLELARLKHAMALVQHGEV